MQNAIKYEKLFSKINKNAKVCIYGTNDTAENIYDALREYRSDVEVKFFVNTKEDGSIKGLPIYRAVDLDAHLNEIDTALVASYASRFYLEFILKSFGATNILLIDKELLDDKKLANREFDVNKSAGVFQTLKDRMLFRFLAKARNDKKKYSYQLLKRFNNVYKDRIQIYPFEHYFEFINTDAVEVALDCGACDGLQSLMMMQRFPNCKKIYAFEPCYDKFKTDLYDKLIKRRKEIEIVPKGLWNEDTQIQFREELEFKAGSAVVEVRSNVREKYQVITINAAKIDTFVQENNINKVDFIKMDIENSEMQALEGAKNTLLKFRPQLAISIYHSNEQFYGIPIYLKELLKDYVFRLGHYRHTTAETVLYGIPKELIK